jgi:hypothetical protein
LIDARHDLPPGPQPPDHLTAVVEIPRGSRDKYELDKVSGLIRLDRAEIQRWEKSELAAEVILDLIRRYEKKYLEHGR